MKKCAKQTAVNWELSTQRGKALSVPYSKWTHRLTAQPNSHDPQTKTSWKQRNKIVPALWTDGDMKSWRYWATLFLQIVSHDWILHVTEWKFWHFDPLGKWTEQLTGYFFFLSGCDDTQVDQLKWSHMSDSESSRFRVRTEDSGHGQNYVRQWSPSLFQKI